MNVAIKLRFHSFLRSLYIFCLFVSYPAYSDETISIASCGLDKDSPGNLVPGSNSTSNVKVNFAGIGEDVVSFKPDEKWMKGSGTSFAASHVTGFIAALLDKEQTGYGKMNYNNEFVENGTNIKELVKFLETEFVIDINFVGTDNATGEGFDNSTGKGFDNATGEGFLTYLKKEEFENAIGNFQLFPNLDENWSPINTTIVNSSYNDTGAALGPTSPFQVWTPNPPKPSNA